MKNRLRQKRSFTPLAIAFLALSLSAAHAQTYVWADNAQGQLYLTCQYASYYWPSNNNWTQTYQTSENCDNTAMVESAPSNWDPGTNASDFSAGVYPGGPGALGVSAILGPPANTFLQSGAHLILNNLTIQADGALAIGANWSIVLNRLELQGDGEITSGSGGFLIQPGGTVIKSGGAGSFSILNPTLDGTNIIFEVDSGTLIFPSGFYAAQVNGGTFIVSNNATLLLTADSNGDPSLNGSITGAGGGTVLINNGAPSSSGCNLNFPSNMLQWTGGGSLRSGPWTNSGVVNISSNGPQFYGGCTFYNNNLVNLADNSSLSFFSPSGAAPGLFNEAGATFNIRGDSSLVSGDGAIYNYGLFVKSVGSGISQITPIFDNYGGTVEADAGTLELNLSGGGYISNATFVVSNGATIDLITNPYDMEIEGSLTGTGGGTVLMSAGTLGSYDTTTFNFPGSMFQWAGGKLGDSYANNVSNIDNMTVSGPVGLNGNFGNNGTMIQSGTGGINSGSDFYNYTNAVYDMQNDGGVFVGNFYNYGLLEKTGGTNISVISSYFYNYGPGATVDVGAATLELTGVNNLFSNTAFSVNSGASLVFDPDDGNYSQEMEGATSGSGGGSIILSNGLIFSDGPATLNFPGSMFQWQGGEIGSSSNPSTLTNIGVINVVAPVALNHVLANSGTMIQSGAGSIGSGNDFYNGLGSVYNIQNDGGISVGNFYNYGVLEKTGGTNTSLITANFYNYGPNATVPVGAATLAFAGSTFFTNTAFAVSPGATLVLANANLNVEMEGAESGSGGGTILLTNGILFSDYPTTLNFPGPMFQWIGGKIGSQNPPSLLTNVGVINVSGPVALNHVLANSGTMIQGGAGSIGAGDYFYNDISGIYNIQNDGGLSINDIYNYGLFEKTGGTNISFITGNFFNWGQIQAPSGALLFTNGTFTQNAGTLQLSPAVSLQSSIVENGGTITGVGAMGNPGDVSMTMNGGVLAPGNPVGTLSFLGHYGFSMANAAALSVVLGGSNQFSQLVVPNSSATVAGTLNVTLANGYAPTLGTQFQIVSTGSRGGTFSTLNVPPGISVTYSNIGVFLTVTSAVPPDLSSPILSTTNSMTNFTFNVGTLSNQNYTIQQNTDLSTSNWTSVTNFTGNGSVFQFVTPVTNIPALFFRVIEP